MKKSFTLLPVYFLFLLASHNSFSQCNPNPTITGDTLLCPNSTGTLQTQEFDSYQWYKRPYNDPNPPQAIPGATNQTLSINSNDVLFHFSVEVTEDTCTATSGEVLVDGLAFLLPFVIHEGEYIVGPNGEALVCEGDTFILRLGEPYTANIQWFKDGSPIPGAHGQTLSITEPGGYTVSGAPGLCPNFILPLGLTVTVEEADSADCITAVLPPVFKDLVIYPNPAVNVLNFSGFSGSGKVEVEIMDLLGRPVCCRKNLVFDENPRLDISHLPAGSYFCLIKSGNQTHTFNFIKI